MKGITSINHTTIRIVYVRECLCMYRFGRNIQTNKLSLNDLEQERTDGE